jgi:hypothetical protein
VLKIRYILFPAETIPQFLRLLKAGNYPKQKFG